MNTKRALYIVFFTIFCILLLQTKDVKADSISGFWSYEEYEDGTIGITAYSGLDEDIGIPAQINGKKVVKIASEAFKNNINIKTVEIPSTVTTIGAQAFAGSGLISVTIPETVTTWESDYRFVPSLHFYYDICEVFAECENLKTVVFNSQMVPNGCFSGCVSLETVMLGNRTQYIKEYAFENDKNLLIVGCKRRFVGNRSICICKL